MGNPTGATLGSSNTVTLTITDNNTSLPTTNPLDNTDALFFVRQHYLDFRNREPDPGGLAYWADQIARCGSDATCANSRHVGVSAAFFIELEFQQTGYVVGEFMGKRVGAFPSQPLTEMLSSSLALR